MRLPGRWPTLRRALLGLTADERRAVAAWFGRYVNPKTGELRVPRGRWDEDDGGAEIPAVSVTRLRSEESRLRQ